jgi:hypothetical protein
MKHIPYGYKIVDGQALIDELKANQIKELFLRYIEGHSLASVSKITNLDFTHSQIGRLLEKVVYLGDKFFPNIISREIFEQVQEERVKRATKLGRNNKVKSIQEVAIEMSFKMGTPITKYNEPFEQAEYLYSLIEMEVKET